MHAIIADLSHRRLSAPLPPAAECRFRILIEPPLTAGQADRRRHRGISLEPRGALVDAESGDVRIFATLAYIDSKVAARGLTVVERRAMTRQDFDPGSRDA